MKQACPLDSKPLKVVKQGGHKNSCQVSGGAKTRITLVGCVIAGGQCLPPMVIWNCKNSQHPSCLWVKFLIPYMGYPVEAD